MTSWFPAVRAITLTLFAIRKMDVSGSQSAVYAVVMDKASILSAPVETQYLPNHAATLMFRKRKQA